MIPSGITDSLGRVFLNNTFLGNGLPLLTQDTWVINSVSGNDANDGATEASALKTPNEFARRLAGRIYAPIPQITIQFRGTFDLQSLIIPPMYFIGPTIITTFGDAPTILSPSSAITAYQAYNAAGGLQAILTDALINFSPWKTKRVRMLTGSGSVPGAVTWYGSIRAGTGNTGINIGQFRALPTEASFWSGSNVTPIVGDHYEVEDLTTVFLRWDIRATGNFQLVIRDCVFRSAAVAPLPFTSNRWNSVCDVNNRGTVKFFGCQIDASAAQFLASGNFGMLGCSIVGAGFNFAGPGYIGDIGTCYFGTVSALGPVVIQGNDCLHDGDGVRSVCCFTWEGATRIELGQRVFRGNVGGSQAHIDLTNGGFWSAENSSALFWSEAPASSLNTTTVALHVGNGAGFVYNSAAKPTATGGVAGSDAQLAADAAIAWAAVPAIASGAADNAYINIRH